MKGRIFTYAKYKAWSHGIITSRINLRNTSRECARCGGLIVRYREGQPVEGYIPGAPLALCPTCGMHGNADRNASVRIGQRLCECYQKNRQEKPPTPLSRERVSKETGVVVCQEANRELGPSFPFTRQTDASGHGPAHEEGIWMEMPSFAIPTQLRLFTE